MRPDVTPFFHAPTSTWSYVVRDPAGSAAALIDPVLDYDPAAGLVCTAPARALLDHVLAHRLEVQWLLETHAHADHLSAAGWLKDALGGPARVGIGAGIVEVQRTFKRLLNLDDGFRTDGSQFDRLFADGERFALGSLDVEVLATPGHTSDSVSYRIGDAVFVGDTVFSPPAGTARCDFPGGDAATLYRSIRRLYALPPSTRVFLCHDYPPPGAAPRAEVTLAEQRAHNAHVRDGVDEAAFVALRARRDAALPVPRLLWPALQVNIRGGRLPLPEANGVAYLRTPLRFDERG
ncbi:MAG TPA: MBL fold metallo-hydrolase [Mizugakiibacter sp.]